MRHAGAPSMRRGGAMSGMAQSRSRRQPSPGTKGAPPSRGAPASPGAPWILNAEAHHGTDGNDKHAHQHIGPAPAGDAHVFGIGFGDAQQRAVEGHVGTIDGIAGPGARARPADRSPAHVVRR
ncbi:hypothetical protein CBM2586_B80143 [Cupriavidus phytorum]|uniref:Uncharacterized protein n=1 Tax=Cupriavidus taiwanensis TaxID=164546 RepID=A0A375CM98_9BURK|nr:hypothetical protein CBM2586_B80143 [Cupriavidus taiwanensis]